jgi:signal transduction histidine kinase/CheY-like chemotaxis protein/HPt (histidine-containing phosphotransfer) domain-containing protein
MFERAVDLHAMYALLLDRIGEVRSVAFAVNEPGNDVFRSHDPVEQSAKLEAAASRFRQRFALLQDDVDSLLDTRSRELIAPHIPTINRSMNYTLVESRQVFAFMSVDNVDSASAHMAAMDTYNNNLVQEISAVEQVIRRAQDAALVDQHSQAINVRKYGLGIAALVLLMAISAGIHGRRVRHAMQKDAVLRKRHTAALNEARAHAEQAARLKTQFLANMSHEIRNPMNGVIGMLDALANTPLSREQAKITKTANLSAALLLAIIDDILDFSKIEAGMLVIEKLPVDIAAVIQHVVSLYTPQAKGKSLELRYELAPQLPARVIADPTRLTQLLTNLVSNAIKFTDRGSVTIRVSLVAQDSDATQIRFAVADTGMGIAAPAQQKLFMAFTQADNSTSRQFGGTGLGLAICRQLVQLIDPEHGEIGVLSSPGAGAEFFFILRLPLAASESVDLPANNAHLALAQRQKFAAKVLVAEDNETNQQVVLMLLRGLGIEPTLVVDGEEAAAAVLTERFDLILMDYHMPRLDGSGAAAAIRKYENEQGLARTPIIALSASVLSEDRARCYAAGMDDFLAKPLRSQNLSTMLDKWLPGKAVAINTTEHAATMAESVALMGSDLDANPLAVGPFDRAQLHEMMAVIGAAFPRLIAQFHDNMHTAVLAMRKSVVALDPVELASVAHKLKGSAATFGATQIAAQCERLEVLGKSGSVAGAHDIIEALVHAYMQAKPHMDDCAASLQARAG